MKRYVGCEFLEIFRVVESLEIRCVLQNRYGWEIHYRGPMISLSYVSSERLQYLSHMRLAPHTPVRPSLQPRVLLTLFPDEDRARFNVRVPLHFVQPPDNWLQHALADSFEDYVCVACIANMETRMRGMLCVGKSGDTVRDRSLHGGFYSRVPCPIGDTHGETRERVNLTDYANKGISRDIHIAHVSVET